MTNPNASVTERLKEAAGPEGWSENPEEIAPHLAEWRGRWKGTTPLLLKPDSTDAVARILGICDATATPIVPQGGNTGLVGGQIPTKGEVLLSLARMNRIRAISTADNTLTAEAGVVLANIQKAADEAGRLFPLSLASEGSCTIGGNTSTNAGGVNVLRYGMTRELVLGLEVVLANGHVLDVIRGLRKDNTGYDLKQLFIGAEGTLGIVTAVMVKLFPKPAGYSTVLTAVSDVGVAVELLHRLQAATGGLVTAFELMQARAIDLVIKHIPGTVNPFPAHQGWTVLIEVSNPSAFDATEALEQALAQAMEEGMVVDAVFAKTARDRQALWRLRESIPEAQRQDGASIANDISVPLSQIPEFIASAEEAVRRVLPEARPFTFGHVGDGNLHFAIQAPGHDAALLAARSAMERTVQEETERLRGSISAEHGLGLAKNEAIALYKSADEIAVMRALKRALDPNNILNPGKLLPPGRG
ncbi:MAG TPA: FAD-binding oxidoreductase [Micropepsaceae bacterium]|jgi:FAD/FMN-containing dehydrogenase|nr:FAD-binding oxidoreductase [Micropepsaceae bacterium]